AKKGKVRKVKKCAFSFPDQLHSAFISDVEIMKAGSQTVSSGINKPATVPATNFDSKLAQFLENAKKADESASKIIDGNGEPVLVFYGEIF
ncbi:MAG: hypothetical protein M3Q33_07145, partial [Acidobacteriota bacterium]|nr:hypothetical protein [Acidobacteriota bacterium]